MTHKDFLEQVGIEIKVARVRRKLSVPDVCKLTGLGRSCVQSVESGKTDVKLLTLKRLADALGVDMAMLFR